MVLYHTDGRVVIAHENYLEQEARKVAIQGYYIDQIECGKVLHAEVTNTTQHVFIVVEEQEFRTLYSSYRDPGDIVPQFSNEGSERFPKDGIDRTTFMKYSTLADDVFRCEPSSLEVRLPVTYPRMHAHNFAWNDFQEEEQGQPLLVPLKKYRRAYDHHMAYIRKDEINRYIIPWLKSMEKVVQGNTKAGEQRKADSRRDLSQPAIEIPSGLLERIHLYNAMLQLGLPRSVQQPVIDALVLQMYQTKLNACHLETLEITIGRFYGRGVAILDPVINHFIGTYAFRSIDDLQHPTAISEADDGQPSQDEDVSAPAETQSKAYEEESPYGNLKRKFLEYSFKNADREEYPNDTFIVPPELPVLGHCIKHWSGIRSNGSIAAAHTGYPLNVGIYRKFSTRAPARANNTGSAGDVEEHYTYRLRQAIGASNV